MQKNRHFRHFQIFCVYASAPQGTSRRVFKPKTPQRPKKNLGQNSDQVPDLICQIVLRSLHTLCGTCTPTATAPAPMTCQDNCCAPKAKVPVPYETNRQRVLRLKREKEEEPPPAGPCDSQYLFPAFAAGAVLAAILLQF